MKLALNCTLTIKYTQSNRKNKSAKDAVLVNLLVFCRRKC